MIQRLDQLGQRAVDAAAFAVMRRTGVSKYFIRYGLNLAVTTWLAVSAFAGHFRSLGILPIAMFWIWVTVTDKRLDDEAEAANCVSWLDAMNPRTQRRFRAFIAAVSVVSIVGEVWLEMPFALLLITLSYLKNTPTNPPPAKARESATQKAMVTA